MSQGCGIMFFVNLFAKGRHRSDLQPHSSAHALAMQAAGADSWPVSRTLLISSFLIVAEVA